MNISVLNISFHRNGIRGAPFHAILFEDDEADSNVKLGIVFDEPWHTAVLDVAKLVRGDIAFGSNSWRGDVYEPHCAKRSKPIWQRRG